MTNLLKQLNIYQLGLFVGNWERIFGPIFPDTLDRLMSTRNTQYRKLHQQFWRRIVTEILMATEMNQAKLAKLLAVDTGWIAEVLTEQLDPTLMEEKIPTLLQLHDEYWYLKQSRTVHK